MMTKSAHIIIQIRPTELNDLHIDPKTKPGNGHCQASFFLLADLSQLETKHRRQGITNPLIIPLCNQPASRYDTLRDMHSNQASSGFAGANALKRCTDAQMQAIKVSLFICSSVLLS